MSTKRNSKKTSAQKAQDILTKLESVDNKFDLLINEDIEKMKNLVNYNRKTQ